MSLDLFVSERQKPEATTKPLAVGCLIYDQMDQIDFTGPFEVLSRMPDSSLQVIGRERSPIQDMFGLKFAPQVKIVEAAASDVLVVPGGYGQTALMHDEQVLSLIRTHLEQGRIVFFGLHRSAAVWSGRYSCGTKSDHALVRSAFVRTLRSGGGERKSSRGRQSDQCCRSYGGA